MIHLQLSSKVEVIARASFTPTSYTERKPTQVQHLVLITKGRGEVDRNSS